MAGAGTDHLFGLLASGRAPVSAPVTRAELCEVVGSLQPIPAMREVADAIAVARAAGLPVEQRVLSDANITLIEVVLQQLRLRDAFSCIVSNGSHWEGERLRAAPFLSPDVATAQSSAVEGGVRTSYCPANLCKGAVVASWLAELRPERCIYIGDGRGDYSAGVQLRPERDLLCARADYPLHKLLQGQAAVDGEAPVVARWLSWVDGKEVLAEVEQTLEIIRSGKL
eukprot:COSAG02_NODE_3168_length_7242_cov_2.120118_6_plen_226_part_00